MSYFCLPSYQRVRMYSTCSVILRCSLSASFLMAAWIALATLCFGSQAYSFMAVMYHRQPLNTTIQRYSEIVLVMLGKVW